VTFRGRRFWLLYIAWIVICAAAFMALRGAEDPSRPKGRILSIEAGMRARQILLERDPSRYRGYEVVHVAHAKAGEAGAVDRWIVLLDRVPHTSLREAVVVEVRAEDGKALLVRRAVLE
jgi:hypothetical protein